MNIKYQVFDPVGNITVLVETPVKDTDRRFVARKIMQKETNAEQVGFVDHKENIVKLEMAGGEFCGNACRCASLMTGAEEVVCDGQKVLCNGTQAQIPSNIKGIEHFVFEEMIEEPEKKIREIAMGQAVGFMFINLETMEMKPLVYVPGAETIFWENSCASGCVAVALYLSEKYGRYIDKELKQPGGIIRVQAGPGLDYVTIDSEINFVKKDEICIPELNY